MFIFVVLFIDIMFILGLIAYFVALCTGNLPFSSEIIYNTSFWSVVVAIVSFVLALNAFLFSWKASRPDIKIYGKKFDNKLLKPWIKVKYQKKDYFCIGLSFVYLSYILRVVWGEKRVTSNIFLLHQWYCIFCFDI